mgnify:CR=1 FL=1
MLYKSLLAGFKPTVIYKFGGRRDDRTGGPKVLCQAVGPFSNHQNINLALSGMRQKAVSGKVSPKSDRC